MKLIEKLVNWYKNLKISAKLLILFVAPVFSVFVVFYFVTTISYNNSLEDMLMTEISHAKKSFFDMEEHDIKAFSSTIGAIVHNPKIKELYLQKNRDELYAFVEPLFRELKNEHGITHWYFILPNGEVFLRVHEKEIFGDEVKRDSFRKALENGKIGAGIDLGKTAYALRTVMPYYEGNELIGYIELGEEIVNFVERLKGETDNDYFLIADKSHLNKKDWEDIRAMDGRRNNWNDDISHVIVNDGPDNNDLHKECFNEKNINFIEQGQESIGIDKKTANGCGGFLIDDGKNSHLGMVLASIDMSEHLSVADRISTAGYAGIAVLISFLIGVSIFYVRLISRPIKKLVGILKMIMIGDITQRAKVESRDEIGELAAVFNMMIGEVNYSKKIINEEVELQTQEIKEQKQRMENQRRAIMNILEDVKDEKEKVEILAKDLEKFKLAVENASDHIVITDAEGVVLYANKAVEKITGFSNEEVIGKKAGSKNLWGGLMKKEFYVEFWKTIKEDKKVFIGEFRNKRKDKEEYDAAASISPILDNDGKVVFFIEIERDITKEKEIDKAKTEFVSLASHQLRTPLTAINWYVEMLITGDAGRINKEQKNYLEEVHKGSKRMVDLVNALLNVSRIDLGTFAIDPEPTDFSKVSKDVLSELKPSIIKKKMKIEEVYDEKLPLINADPKLVRIIFQNLLSNAVKYTPENGTISVEIKKDGKDASIKIADDGYGIPKGQQSRIFEKLFRADNARQKETDGTGLGLYVLKSIIEKNKGKIWFDSVENKGTTFYVKMPLSGMKKKEGAKGLSAT